MNKQILLPFFFLLTSFWAFSQQRTVSGTVTSASDNSLMPGVAVVIKGTTTGVATDFNGLYEIGIPDGDVTLVFSFLGFETRERLVSGKTTDSKITLNIKLEEESFGLNTVVVTGSRKQEKVLESPASISVISSKQIEQNVAITAVENLRLTPGVDIVQTGLTSTNVVVRGFNNIFSGSLLTLVDNRIARVPSLRFNANNLIPTSDEDIERMEVLRGPASALYGPNSANGVLHIITKSPLDLEDKRETQITAMGGLERSVLKFSARHAGRTENKKFGYKVSGGYWQGHDWPYIDSFEVANGPFIYFGKQTAEGRQLTGDSIPNWRDIFLKKWNADVRLDFKPTDDIEVIAAGGTNTATGIELTGIGAAQARGWTYSYGQLRFRWKDLFLQAFVNSSNAGNTFLLRSGDLIIDKSKLWTYQIQHSYSPLKTLRFIYGADALLTRPNTEYTINGRNEDDDNINEVGVYVQGDYDVHPKLKIVAAARGDYHNFVDGFFVSPRTALVYKPSGRHTFRTSYNRAFSSPSSNNLNLDILQGGLPTGMSIRAVGNRNGYNFTYGDNPFIAGNPVMPQYTTPFSESIPGYGQFADIHLNDPNMNDVFWNITVGLVENEFKSYVNSIGRPDLVPLIGTVIGSLLPSSLEGNVGNEIKALDLTSLQFVKESPDNIVDLKAVRNSPTETYEIGYKGLLFNKLLLTADFYVTRQKDFVSPLVLASPNVFLDEKDLQTHLSAYIAERLDSFPALNDILKPLLDENPQFGGNNNGTVLDELVTILVGAGRQIPFGTITPQGNGTDMLVTYVNIGDVMYWGTDIGATFMVTDEIRLTAAYSYMSRDTFQVKGAQFGYISINSPKHKVSTAIDYESKKYGFNVGLRWRWQDKFLANSGAYVGPVAAFNVIDFAAGYNFPFSKGTNVALLITNLLDQRFVTFAGTPPIGRLSMIKISHRF